MTNLPLSAVSTPGPTSPPFGGTPDRLVLAHRLESIDRQLGESRAMTDIGAASAARAELVGAQASVREIARSLRQSADLEAWTERQDAAVKSSIKRAPSSPPSVLTPTGRLKPMAPLSGYNSVAEDVRAVRRARPLLQRARHSFGLGQVLFVLAILALIGLCATIGGCARPADVSPTQRAAAPAFSPVVAR